MDPFTVTILGSGAAVPARERNPTAQWVQCKNRHFLIDCGEGTQLQIRRYGLGFKNIKAIFISHLHGDHYFGLFGLLSTLSLVGRRAPMPIIGPPGLQEILSSVFKGPEGALRFPLEFTLLDEPAVVYEDSKVEVRSFKVDHRTPTWGFRVSEKPGLRHLDGQKADDDGIPGVFRLMLKEGKDITWEGKEFHSDDYTLPPDPVRSYSYGADSAPAQSLEDGVRDSDMAYLEATFTSEHTERAKKTRHMTAGQAAALAKRANVGQLLLGHFSARYRSLDNHMEEAQAEFDKVLLVEEGTTYSVG